MCKSRDVKRQADQASNGHLLGSNQKLVKRVRWQSQMHSRATNSRGLADSSAIDYPPGYAVQEELKIMLRHVVKYYPRKQGPTRTPRL